MKELYESHKYKIIYREPLTKDSSVTIEGLNNKINRIHERALRIT